MPKFEKGDVVQHKGGGPKLTVQDPKNYYERVSVRYWDAKKEAFVDEEFEEASLEPWEDDDLIGPSMG